MVLASFRSANPADTPQVAAPEYAVKAAFIYHFIQYVTWPKRAFPSQDSPVVIGVLGQDPFGDAIDKVVEGRSLNSHRIEIQRVTLEDAFARCQVVFISRENRPFLINWLRTLGTKPILLITESPGELPTGAMIHFVMQGKKLQYDINLETAEKSGLKLATPMLVSARRLLSQEPEGRNSR